jgi:hypothetical protein
MSGVRWIETVSECSTDLHDDRLKIESYHAVSIHPYPKPRNDHARGGCGRPYGLTSFGSSRLSSSSPVCCGLDAGGDRESDGISKGGGDIGASADASTDIVARRADAVCSWRSDGADLA